MKSLKLKIIFTGLLLVFIQVNYVKSNTKIFNATSKKFIYVEVFFKEAKPLDTLTLILYNIPAMVRQNSPDNLIVRSKMNAKGTYLFSVPVTTKNGYFGLEKTRTSTWKSGHSMEIMEPQFWEEGDSIKIDLNYIETVVGLNSHYKVTGRGAEKYNANNELANFKSTTLDNHIKINGKRYVSIPSDFKGLEGDICLLSEWDKAKFELLDKKYKNIISDVSYSVLKSGIPFNGVTASWQFRKTLNYFRDSIQNSDEKEKKEYYDRSRLIYNHNEKYGLIDDQLANSYKYIIYLNEKLIDDSYIHTGNYSLDWMYSYIKNHYKGRLRDNLIIRVFINPIRNSQNADSLYNDASKLINDSLCLKVLSNLKKRMPGSILSDFVLENTNKVAVKLSDFRNKVVLIDLWFTGCGPCQEFYKSTLSKAELRYENNDKVVFISICVDKQRDLWLKNLKNYSSSKAVNLYTNGEGLKHIFLTKNNIYGFPTAILLDKDGIVRNFQGGDLYNYNTLTMWIEKLL